MRGETKAIWHRAAVGRVAMLVAAGLLASAATASAAAPTITEFTTGVGANDQVGSIAGGPDGNLYFIDTGSTGVGDTIGRVAPSTGAITDFTAGADLSAITTGPDKNLWVVDFGPPPTSPRAVFSVSPGALTATGSGNPTEYATPDQANGGNMPQIITGPDRNLWLVEYGGNVLPSQESSVDRVTPSGQVTAFDTNQADSPNGIAPGPDGNVWFTESNAAIPPASAGPATIDKITPSGTITPYTAGLPAGSTPVAITLGPDGNLWFVDDGTTPAIGRITPSGQITEYSQGLNSGSYPNSIAAGPDGNLWFTDGGTTPAIGQITTSGQITEYSAGLSAGSDPTSITLGPDGNLWFTDDGGFVGGGQGTSAIGEVVLPKSTPTPTPTVDTLTVDVTGSGTVSGAGISCPGTCSASVNPGTQVTLTASPASGSTFAGWSGGGCSGTGACTVTVSAATTVTATFTKRGSPSVPKPPSHATAKPSHTKITKAKINAKQHTASFSFTARGATGYQCALIAPPKKGHKLRAPKFGSCHSPKSYAKLKAGKYTFEVRGFNAKGADPSPAKKAFKIK